MTKTRCSLAALALALMTSLAHAQTGTGNQTTGPPVIDPVGIDAIPQVPALEPAKGQGFAARMRAWTKATQLRERLRGEINGWPADASMIP